MLINSPNISGSLTVTGNATISGSLNVAGGINATITGSATSASYVEYSNVANKPTLVSGSAQVAAFGFATTGSNQFNGSQAITGSLTVTGQVIAQTLNVQQVTSSIVYSSGSNIFGNSLSDTQQLTGSVSVTGSMNVNGTPVSVGTGSAGQVAFWNGTSSQTGDNGLFWDNTNKRLTVGNSPAFTWSGSQLEVRNQIRIFDSASSSFGLRFGFNSNVPFIQGFRETVGAVNLQLQPSGGNVLINTTTDAGFRLDVNGSTRFNGLSTIQGTTASDSGQLGAELLTTGTGDASWTGTSFATGYTHVVGSTTTLTSTLAGVVNTFYQITYTVTGRTAGSFTIAFGGFTSAALTATGAVGPRATTTGTLVITPTSDFDGTIVLSIRVISASSASVTFNSSSGVTTNQIRISSNSTNTIMGSNAGTRNTTGTNLTVYGRTAGQNNTTGVTNSFFGDGAGGANTIGSNNSFFGAAAGSFTTTGGTNSAFGVNSLLFNTTGNSNSAFGRSALQANTTGGTNTALGSFALGDNTTSNNNVGIGSSALQTNSSGGNNTALGGESGRFTGSGNTAMTSVNNSIYLGYRTRGLNATGSTNEVVIGYDVVGLGSNTTVLGNTSTTHGRWYGSLLLGTTTNAASSILTMDSTTQGFLPPRMTATQRNAIASPATGLVVYQTDGVEGLYVRTSTAWRALAMV